MFLILDGVFDASSGYPCKDQIGRSTDQVLSPVYGWNNDFLGTVGGNLIVAEHGENTVTSTWHVLEHRDFFNEGVSFDAASASYVSAYTGDDGTPLPWTYRPYVYPHPLTLLP